MADQTVTPNLQSPGRGRERKRGERERTDKWSIYTLAMLTNLL